MYVVMTCMQDKSRGQKESSARPELDRRICNRSTGFSLEQRLVHMSSKDLEVYSVVLLLEQRNKER
jgi:hypothetical protein